MTLQKSQRLQKLATGADVINLSIGSPDLPPASHITEAMVRAIQDPGMTPPTAS